jgi:hypothetical protein
MNYIIFNEWNGNYSLRGIRETETARYLEDYLAVYVDKTAEEIEADGITMFDLPDVLPTYVIDALRHRLNLKLVKYVNSVFDELTLNYSTAHRALLPELFSQANKLLHDVDNSMDSNYSLINSVATIRNESTALTASNIVSQVEDCKRILNSVFELETIINSNIYTSTTLPEFYAIHKELDIVNVKASVLSINSLTNVETVSKVKKKSTRPLVIEG